MARKGIGIPPLNSEQVEASLNTITVHGKKLVGGLLWEPLDSPRHYMSEAKRIGKERKMEMVAIRKSDSAIQAGFAPRTKERLKGYYSLAATLAGCLGESWMGAFSVEDGRYVFVTVIDGIVLPGQDIIGDREKVEQALKKTYSLVTADPGKQIKLQKRIIAPAEFNFSNDNRTLGEILTPDAFRKEHQLTPLALGLTTREIVLGVVGITILGGAAFGALWWLDLRQARELQAEAMRKADELQKQKLEAQRAIPQPWLGQPNAKLMLDAAAHSLKNTRLSYGGWGYIESACDTQQCAAIYARPDDGAPIGAFLQAAQSVNGARLADNKGVVYYKVDLKPETGDLLKTMQQREFNFINYFQAFGPYVQATIEAPKDEVQPEDPAAQVTWKKRNFTVGTSFPPELLFEGLDLAGLRINSIVTRIPDQANASSESAQSTFNCGDAVICWSINGELYGR
ncbi:hypothetical protein LMG31884_47420 (plasmid) [Xanthomonas hydrangeae]|uniref:type 4b pilus protein PilO2 n=1 Tax=Xanthomonas hydrangeae TaxID=2775159 RepID=UPI0019656713|nr:hypothetical protein LMG31884_47420 [Xanthomonas hydrangeae]CAD7741214.1 hypothetical protein LMG31884_47420 [Xanthomonas hydrangeae]CAD7747936.1 hypothetical protein LMG31887_46390 [Xanthomonas hydrangeae]CAD7747937.1 hypothetical protein LMG31887_46390 [Xanthomonas hydrangeae]CAD7748186.1 hypothetical protein LMG31885_45100 [Xanthomonas hydrangeae]